MLKILKDRFYTIINNNPALDHPRYLDGTQPTGNNVYANDQLLGNPNQKWVLKLAD